MMGQRWETQAARISSRCTQKDNQRGQADRPWVRQEESQADSQDASGLVTTLVDRACHAGRLQRNCQWPVASGQWSMIKGQ